MERLDTSPFKLTVGLKVLMHDTVTKWWEIPGEVVSIHPGGRSAYIKTESNNRTYLRNRRLLRVDTAIQSNYETSFEITCEECSPGLPSSLRVPSLHSRAEPGRSGPQYIRREQCRKRTVDFRSSKRKSDSSQETKLQDGGP